MSSIRMSIRKKADARRTIALAIDPSEYAEYAFEWYLTYIHHPENVLVCIHVPEGFDVNKAQKDLAEKGQMKANLERQYSKIEELESKFQNRMRTNGIKGHVLSVPSKTPGQTIVETAKDEGCFAIVIGTRGLSKLKKVILGSVSDYVMTNADMPVIVVRPNRQEKEELKEEEKERKEKEKHKGK